MRRLPNPDSFTVRDAVRPVLWLLIWFVVLAIIGMITEPARATTCAVPVVAAPQVVLPAYPSYTQTGFTSNTLNLVAAPMRAEAAQQWAAQQQSPAWPQQAPQYAQGLTQQLAALRAQILALEQQAAQQLTQQPQAPAPQQGPPPAPTPGNPQPGGPLPGLGGPPAYAYAAAIPTIVAHCARCHTEKWSPEGPAGGVFLDGSDDVRADASEWIRGKIQEQLADKKMPPEGHTLSGELVGKIWNECYKDRSAGGNPANTGPSP